MEWGREGRRAHTCQTSLLSQALEPFYIVPLMAAFKASEAIHSFIF